MKFNKKDKFHEMYTLYKDDVYRIATHYSKGDFSAAEEIMQNIFIAFYQYIDEIEEETAQNWLMVVTKNYALNRLKKLEKEYLAEEIFDVVEEEPLASGIEEELLKRKYEGDISRLSDEIFFSIKEKNERWYEAVSLVYGMEKSQKEAAKIMGVTLQSLNSMLYRARRWINKQYGQEYKELEK